MTRKEFESIPFNQAMYRLYEETDCIDDYDSLCEHSKVLIDERQINFAMYILKGLWESTDKSDWYYYRRGIAMEPICLYTVDDVEKYIGFDKE